MFKWLCSLINGVKTKNVKFADDADVVTINRARVREFTDQELDSLHRFTDKVNVIRYYNDIKRLFSSIERVYPELLPVKVTIGGNISSLPKGKPGQSYSIVKNKWEDIRTGPQNHLADAVIIDDPWQTFGTEAKKKTTSRKQAIDKQPKKVKHTPVKKK